MKTQIDILSYLYNLNEKLENEVLKSNHINL